MIFLQSKDIKARNLFFKVEKLRRIKKCLFINLLNNPKSLAANSASLGSLQYLLDTKLQFSSKSKVKLTRRCILTNRNRGVFRSHNISRVAFRELLQFGIIPGYKKAVW